MSAGDGIVDSQQLPCGCTMQRVIEGGQRVLKIEACDRGLGCVNLANALLVAAHDEAKAKAEALRADARHFGHFDSMSSRLHAAADHLDRLADLLIDARLVAAAHAQWAEDEEPS